MILGGRIDHPLVMRGKGGRVPTTPPKSAHICMILGAGWIANGHEGEGAEYPPKPQK